MDRVLTHGIACPLIVCRKGWQSRNPSCAWWSKTPILPEQVRAGDFSTTLSAQKPRLFDVNITIKPYPDFSSTRAYTVAAGLTSRSLP